MLVLVLVHFPAVVIAENLALKLIYPVNLDLGVFLAFAMVATGSPCKTLTLPEEDFMAGKKSMPDFTNVASMMCSPIVASLGADMFRI